MCTMIEGKRKYRAYKTRFPGAAAVSTALEAMLQGGGCWNALGFSLQGEPARRHPRGAPEMVFIASGTVHDWRSDQGIL